MSLELCMCVRLLSLGDTVGTSGYVGYTHTLVRVHTLHMSVCRGPFPVLILRTEINKETVFLHGVRHFEPSRPGSRHEPDLGPQGPEENRNGCTVPKGRTTVGGKERIGRTRSRQG